MQSLVSFRQAQAEGKLVTVLLANLCAELPFQPVPRDAPGIRRCFILGPCCWGGSSVLGSWGWKEGSN